MSAKNWTFVTSKAVWLDQSLSVGAKVIWHVLSAFRNHETGEAFPKTWTLQQVTGMGRHKVERAITELVKAGAIKKTVIRLPGKTGTFAGSKCVYSVNKLSSWKSRTAPTVLLPGPPVTGATGNQHLTVSQYQTINQPRTVTQLFSPAKPEQTSKLLLTESETEDLLADWDASVASAVFESMESSAWRDSHGREFHDAANRDAYMRGLADKIAAARGCW